MNSNSNVTVQYISHYTTEIPHPYHHLAFNSTHEKSLFSYFPDIVNFIKHFHCQVFIADLFTR